MEYKSQNVVCQNCKATFIIEPDDFSFYKKIKVPPPTFCPLCRAQRRFTFRNERKFFKIKDAFTEEEIFSLIPLESKRRVITQEKWYGDSWDAMEYSKEYDFSRSFFEQYLELEKQVPIFNLNVQRMINSPYCGNATALKNSYLCFHSNYSEDCMYGSANDFCKNCVDCSYLKQSDSCYDSFWLTNCYQCHFSITSADSRNLWFCRDCVGCNDCLGCANLRQSSYCIFNQKYSKEEYENKMKEFNLHNLSGIEKIKNKARKFWNTQPIKNHQGLRNLNSSGSYVTGSKNVKDSYLIREGENLRYCQYLQVPKTKDSYDTCVWGENMELNYETCTCGENSYDVKFSFNCWPTCRNVEYSSTLFSCSDCFGCVGLKKKQYCILNKQYTKEEYEKMIGKIKRHMDDMPYVDSQGLIYKYGEFFPIEFSPYGYNNTIAQQHFTLSKEEAEKKGYMWIEVPHGEYEITKKAGELPDLIDDVTNDILKEVIECNICKNAFRVIKNELIFYRKEKLPLPNLCYECRFERRMNDRLKVHLYERTCMCAGEKDITGIYKNTIKHFHGDKPCGEKFKTGYAPDRPEIVYCEKCYQQEVY